MHAPHVIPAKANAINVLNIVVDDEKDIGCGDYSARLPRSAHWFAAGTCFQNATVSDPECCPSRATGMTGQYAHNTGVRQQIDTPKFKSRDSLQFYFQQNGYLTYMVDKLLNGDGEDRAPKYFDRYAVRNNYDYYDAEVREDGVQKVVSEYAPTYFGALARTFMKDAVAQGKPFYMYEAFRTPHTQLGGDPGPIVEDKYANAPVPPFHYHTEVDVSDKPKVIQYVQPNEDEDSATRLNALRERAMLSVDDQIAETFSMLRRLGVLDKTMVIFWSDNGFSLGQNSVMGKGRPYDPSLNIPMVVVPPSGRKRLVTAFPVGAVDDRMVDNTDIAPTLLDAAGIVPHHLVDGHSLVSPYSRKFRFHEFFHDPSARYEAGNAFAAVPSWAKIASRTWSYIEYYRDDGSVLHREYYDLTRDPREENNLLYGSNVGTVSPRRLSFAIKKLGEERVCAGTLRSGSPYPCT